MNRPGNKNKIQWKITYHQAVVKIDIKALGTKEAHRIKDAIERKLTIDPAIYGIPLRGTLKHYWKLRVGDYRIVYTIVKEEVRILIIAHRKNVYSLADTRRI